MVFTDFVSLLNYAGEIFQPRGLDNVLDVKLDSNLSILWLSVVSKLELPCIVVSNKWLWTNDTL